MHYYREVAKDPDIQGSEITEDFVIFLNDLFDALNGSNKKNAVREDGKFIAVLSNAIPTIHFLSEETIAESSSHDKIDNGHLSFLLRQQGYSYVLTSKLNQD